MFFAFLYSLFFLICLVMPCHSLLHRTMSVLRYGTRLACVIFSQLNMRHGFENVGFGHSRWNCGNDSHFSRSSIIQESFPQRQSAATCMNYLYMESLCRLPPLSMFSDHLLLLFVCFLFLRREREPNLLREHICLC